VQVFEGILRAAGDPMGLFVNYRQLPEAVLGGICSHSGIAFTAEAREQTLEAAKTNAKTPRILLPGRFAREARRGKPLFARIDSRTPVSAL
jgi:hypothetical protein